jgi:hypothetical protein
MISAPPSAQAGRARLLKSITQINMQANIFFLIISLLWQSTSLLYG